MLEIIEGTKVYRDGDKELVVFRGLNLHIERGSFVSITGRSGSGKSTLLHILGCMDRLTGGEYRFEGRRVDDLSEKELARFRGRHFGFVFQSFFLIRELTAVENVEAPMGYAGVPAGKRRERAMELLRRVGLEEHAHRYPDRLSGGQRQRVAIARALANSPDVVFADEPTGNLDRENGERVVELLLDLHREGTTLVLVTHDESLAALAPRRLALRDGRLEEHTVNESIAVARKG